MNSRVMKRITLFIMIVAFGVALWYGGTYLTNSPITHVLPGTVMSAGEMKHVEEGQYYHLEVSYPERMVTLERPAEQRAMNTMETWLIDGIERFKSFADPNQMTPEYRQMLDTSKRKLEYDVLYKEFLAANNRAVSYEFDIFEDTGGAHPNSYFKTFTFDAAGREIKIGELFEPGSDYLNRLASTTYASVYKQLSAGLETDARDAIFVEGLLPKEENFSNFVIDGNTLIILIPPYQAAAYAAGSFVVPISLSDLRDILRPEWK